MITEDFVSFETAKLLKEKGFDVLCHGYFRTNDPNVIVEKACEANWNDETYFTSRPTLQMVMKWLREEHNICIQLTFHQNMKKEWGWYFMYFVMGTNSLKNCIRDFGLSKTYSSYEEACEAAIKCCLENLI